MKRFRFRLHRLERLRQTERREAEIELLGALDRADRRRRGRESIERALREAEERWREQSNAPNVNVEALRQAAAYIRDLRSAVSVAVSEEQASLREVDACEARHVEKARAHRVLERLRTRRLERWRYESSREEQRSLDELHVLKLAGNGEREGV